MPDLDGQHSFAQSDRFSVETLSLHQPLDTLDFHGADAVLQVAAIVHRKETKALLPLYEIGVLRYENGLFFAETVQEKKQIRTALLYPVLCLE